MDKLIGNDILILHYIIKNSRASELNLFGKIDIIMTMKNQYKGF
ncbi:hypothetical protein [Gemella morbillorum]